MGRPSLRGRTKSRGSRRRKQFSGIRLTQLPAVCFAFLACLTAGAFAHFKSTGLTAHRYVAVVAERIEGADLPASASLASLLRSAFLERGPFSDPVNRYPPDIRISLPMWQGEGASRLREDIGPRYDFSGHPIATSAESRWLIASSPNLKKVPVSTASSLRDAVERAEPGTRIEIAPGSYTIDSPLHFITDGTATEPIVLSAPRLGDVVFEFGPEGRIDVSGAYLTIGNVVLRGTCRSRCNAPVKLRSSATASTLRNVFASGFSELLEIQGLPPLLLVEGVTILDAAISAHGTAVSTHSLRQISLPEVGLITVCSTLASTSACDATDLQAALRNAPSGAMVLLRRGVFHQAAEIHRPVYILAEPGAALVDKSINSKAALVVNADTTIEGLECRGIIVSDGNGACVRQQKGNVRLRNVHLHNAQMGVLTGHNGGVIRIIDSYIHDSGSDGEGGLGHNVYVNSGELYFLNSWSLTARNAGHEIKSRAARTIIRNSVIASFNARDSRLVDIPEAGVLEISNSVLGEGPRSENWHVIGYGLEIDDGRLVHPDNRIQITGNTIYLDRPQGTELLHENHARSNILSKNIVVGRWQRIPGNTHFKSRKTAGVDEYPTLTRLTF